MLDMLVEWAIKGEPTTINRKYVDYPAFQIEPNGVDVYDVTGEERPLVRLHTKTGHSLWLRKDGEPTSGLELNRWAQELLNSTSLTPSRKWTVGVTVPMLEMDIKVDLSWMIGATAISPTQGKYAVEQAFQQFKLRANEKGARIEVATGMPVAMASLGPIRTPYVFNDPFIGFFTQPGNDVLPLAAFWADTDSWRNPGGELEEL